MSDSRGAITRGKNTIGYWGAADAKGMEAIAFQLNAAAENSIYNNSTVQPKAFQALIIIKA